MRAWWLLLKSHVLQWCGHWAIFSLSLHVIWLRSCNCRISLSCYLMWYWLFTIFWIQIRSGDTSAAESGSEVEEIASPKPTRSYLHPRLTPVCEEVSACVWSSLKQKTAWWWSYISIWLWRSVAWLKLHAISLSLTLSSLFVLSLFTLLWFITINVRTFVGFHLRLYM